MLILVDSSPLTDFIHAWVRLPLIPLPYSHTFNRHFFSYQSDLLLLTNSMPAVSQSSKVRQPISNTSSPLKDYLLRVSTFLHWLLLYILL